LHHPADSGNKIGEKIDGAVATSPETFATSSLGELVYLASICFHIPPPRIDLHALFGKGELIHNSGFRLTLNMGMTCLTQIASISPVPLQIPALSLHGIQLYTVNHWPLHASCGTPHLADQWAPTPHFSVTLETISVGARRQWTVLLFRILAPRHDSLMKSEVYVTNFSVQKNLKSAP
jgi:hypothetical protein